VCDSFFFSARDKIGEDKIVPTLDVLMDEGNFIAFSLLYFSVSHNFVCTYISEDACSSSEFI
jgi:hypothetical protein